MADSLTEEQTNEFRRAFDLFDNDGSGTISSRELIQAMQNLNLKPREEEIQNIVRQIDSDSGGTIDFLEFLSLMGNKMKAMKKEEDVVQVFRIFDRDRNGYITASELRFAMNQLGYPIDQNEAKRMIQDADKNGDGLVNYEEFYNKIMN
eukprot:maker-scaffold577_size191314-snap-gene-0.34 protein:Tk12274 transcript:maker-scaffold577_size191314-snap-gene-0.34-mRNA-1 annotation:"striated muscle-like"